MSSISRFVIGALTLFSGPTGIAAVGALLVAVGPLKTIVARHTSRFGRWLDE